MKKDRVLPYKRLLYFLSKTLVLTILFLIFELFVCLLYYRTMPINRERNIEKKEKFIEKQDEKLVERKEEKPVEKEEEQKSLISPRRLSYVATKNDSLLVSVFPLIYL